MLYMGSLIIMDGWDIRKIQFLTNSIFQPQKL